MSKDYFNCSLHGKQIKNIDGCPECNKTYFILANGSIGSLTIDEAANIDHPEGTVMTKISATLLKKLMRNVSI